MIKEWIEKSRNELENKGLEISTFSDDDASCISVNIDSDRLVGTVCFWEPYTFEFQFNDCESGDVVFLESIELTSVNEITQYFHELSIKIDI